MRIAEVCVLPVLMLLRKQPAHGAYTTLYAATTPELRNSATEGGGVWGGQYLANCLPKVTYHHIYTEHTINVTLYCEHRSVTVSHINTHVEPTNMLLSCSLICSTCWCRCCSCCNMLQLCMRASYTRHASVLIGDSCTGLCLSDESRACRTVFDHRDAV
jgi:hypothetical protein